MKSLILAPIVAVLMAAVAHAAPDGGTVLRDVASPKSVVVELFTSEGCSSCPPADALLRRLAAERPADGARVIPLGEHVDYWNQLGWRDPYSSAGFSERQGEYSRALRTDGIYTPEMIVRGKAEFVGSDEGRARAEIHHASSFDEGFVPMTLTVRSTGDRQIEVTADATPAATQARGYTLYLALTEDGLTSDVARGENAGHRLTHAAVVRQLDRWTTYNPADGLRGLTRTIAVPVGDVTARMHVVAFVQRPNTGPIVSAAEVDLAGLSATVATRR